MKTIFHIVPQFPPSIDGSGDYAVSLARQLLKGYRINSFFFIGTPYWDENSKITEFPAQKVKTRSVDSLLDLFGMFIRNRPLENPPILVLHYTNYGYAKRGCPFWLIRALKQWKASGHKHLITVFHELYATGYPWKSAFWLSPLQNQLAQSISKISDFSVTSRGSYADILSGWRLPTQHKPITLPVFSNIGEPSHPPPLNKRKRRLVIFGKKKTRKNLPDSRKSLIALSNICNMFNIKEIYDISQNIPLKLSRFNNVNIFRPGNMQIKDISALLLNSVAGFLDYPTNCLAKSGVFASYCAHGLLTFNRHYTFDADGLELNKHYLISSGQYNNISLENVQHITHNARKWYQSHDLSTHAKTFASLFENTLNP